MAIYELDGQAPVLPPDGSHFVAETATVLGRVRLGANCGIWFGVVIRGDKDWIEIGDGSNIQENSTLHTDPGQILSVGRSCTVGHNVILHGCTIEDEVLIGMGSIIMNGARIRRGSVVGAGAIVTEGKEFPERSMILGAPAKAVREVEEDFVTRIARVSASYVDNAMRFRHSLRRIS